MLPVFIIMLHFIHLTDMKLRLFVLSHMKLTNITIIIYQWHTVHPHMYSACCNGTSVWGSQCHGQLPCSYTTCSTANTRTWYWGVRYVSLLSLLGWASAKIATATVIYVPLLLSWYYALAINCYPIVWKKDIRNRCTCTLNVHVLYICTNCTHRATAYLEVRKKWANSVTL